jgi:hypothetical protein
MAWNHRCKGSYRGWQGSSLSISRDTSDSKPALSTEAPVDSAAWQHDARDLATELLFKGWTPGYELKAEAIVDHREPTRTQGDRWR